MSKKTINKNRMNGLTTSEFEPTTYTNTQPIDPKDVAERAYSIYERKGGSAVDNWLEAERLIKEERGYHEDTL